MRTRSIYTAMTCIVLTSAGWSIPGAAQIDAAQMHEGQMQKEQMHDGPMHDGPMHDGQMHQEHEHSGAASSGLSLNGTEKWQTDAALRAGMAAIHTAFAADHPAIHAGKQTDARYDALADRIEKQVQFIVANCKLPAAADANLHYVVADLMQGVSLMRGADPAQTRHDGAALVHGALRSYPRFFDDPTWAAPQPVH